jgi:putative transposase
VAKSTVEKYRPRPKQPPSPTWKTFLKNHVQDLVALDFFVVPTVTFWVLFGLVILAHERRRIVHFNITEHPTAQWTAQQVVEAFPWDEAPRYLLRDRDRIYGAHFRRRVRQASITVSATFGHSASPDNGTCLHIMALQGAMQVYVKYFGNFCHHNPLYSHHL